MSASNLRVVHEDERVETFSSTLRASSGELALRPTNFDDFIGQREVIAALRGAVRAARRGGWQLDHQLFGGFAGSGKTSLAGVIAAELGAKLRATSAPAIAHKGALASLLTTLSDGDVLFIDEIHALDRKLAEVIYSALEDRVIDLPAGERVIRVHLPKFTLLAATTHAGKVPKPLLDRFGFVWQMRAYTLSEMATIIARSARKLGVAIDEDGAEVIARASRGTPRIANRLLRRVRDAAANAAADAALVPSHLEDLTCGAINGPLALAALAQLGIDQLGLDQLDRRYLAIVAERPIGIEAICAGLAEARSTIEDLVEPGLVQLGFVARTHRGRLLTATGLQHWRNQKVLASASSTTRSASSFSV
ncbi:MAG: Holliday junction branch migration DNA helicase RuvB [Gemmatimonadaceae bacterium]|nr:Holliday junction branch migration DNA helicase RuvB [Gemmatimonadaceae bacterium]